MSSDGPGVLYRWKDSKGKDVNIVVQRANTANFCPGDEWTRISSYVFQLGGKSR